MSWHRPNSTAGKITSPFGPRGPIANAPDASRNHLGVDLRAGTLGVTSDIYAATAGTVRRIYQTPIGAWVLELDHGGGVRTRYAHMQRAGIAVKAGAKVTGGQRVAAASNSGAPTVHLHFEVLINGVQVDPVPFLRARGVDLTVTTTAGSGGGTGLPNISTPGGQLPAPILPKGFLDMLTDEEQRKLLDNTDSLLAILLHGSEIGGVKYSGMVPVLATVFGDVKKVPGRVWTDVAVQRSTGPVSVIQELANAGTALAQLRGEVAGAQAALAIRGTGTDLTADQLEQVQAAARRGAAEGVADGIAIRVIVTTQEDPA